jgi:hypothetical protein
VSSSVLLGVVPFCRKSLSFVCFDSFISGAIYVLHKIVELCGVALGLCGMSS